MLLSASHQEITLVPTEYKARQPQGQSGQFGVQKNLFLLQDSNPRSPRLQPVHYTDYATLAPLRAGITIMDSLRRR
jgi:hypothetical protein